MEIELSAPKLVTPSETRPVALSLVERIASGEYDNVGYDIFQSIGGFSLEIRFEGKSYKLPLLDLVEHAITVSIEHYKMENPNQAGNAG